MHHREQERRAQNAARKHNDKGFRSMLYRGQGSGTAPATGSTKGKGKGKGKASLADVNLEGQNRLLIAAGKRNRPGVRRSVSSADRNSEGDEDPPRLVRIADGDGTRATGPEWTVPSAEEARREAGEGRPEKVAVPYREPQCCCGYDAVSDSDNDNGNSNDDRDDDYDDDDFTIISSSEVTMSGALKPEPAYVTDEADEEVKVAATPRGGSKSSTNSSNGEKPKKRCMCKCGQCEFRAEVLQEVGYSI